MPHPRFRCPTGHLLSLALHAGVAGWLFVPPGMESGPRSLSKTAAVQILVPPTGVERQRGTPVGALASAGPSASPGSLEDLRGLEIVIRADPRREILPVLRRYRGLLGFAATSRPRFLIENFDADSGAPSRVGQSLDAWLAFRIWEPESWPELSRLPSASAEERIAYALFPLSFQAGILGEIRAQARRQSCRGPHPQGGDRVFDEPTVRHPRGGCGGGGLCGGWAMKAALIAALLVLVLPPVYVAGLGAAAGWTVHAGGPLAGLPAQIFSAALHLGWIAAAASRRAAAVILLGCPFSVYLCRQGLAALRGESTGWWAALCLESIPLVLAWSFMPASAWADRFARWRRARAAVSVQLHMGPGLFPWLRDSVSQLLFGAPDGAAGAGHQRFLAELAEAECRLRVRLADLALPEQLRQSVLSRASELRAQAGVASARLHFELEHQALAAAAASREECEAMTGLPPELRERLARECEDLFAGLVRQVPAPTLQEVQ